MDKTIFDHNIALLESFTESIPAIIVYGTIGSGEFWFNYAVILKVFGY